METILAETETHQIELITSPMKMVTIVEKNTGMAISVKSKGPIAKEIRDCVREAGAEKTIATYTRVAEYTGAKWVKLYK